MEQYPTTSKITMVINKKLSVKAINKLNSIGIQSLYIEAGRTSILKEKKGFSLLMNKINLEYAPVEVISFYVPKKDEKAILNYIYHEFGYKTPGRGNLISQDVEVVSGHDYCHLNSGTDIPEYGNAILFRELTGICCVLQRGDDDKLAKASLDKGTSVPITTYGEGSGVRDKLGLLRITISPGKALINLVISTYDTEAVLELFVTEGRLYEPGRGIAYTYEIKQGIMNTKISSEKSGEVASIEQVVYALDTIKGGMEWRRSGRDNQSYRRRPFMTNLMELTLICDDGMATHLATTAMEHGAPGATISKVKYVTMFEEDKTTIVRDMCRMIISPNLIEGVVNSIDSVGGFGDEAHGFIHTLHVPKAFTYLGKKK